MDLSVGSFLGQVDARPQSARRVACSVELAARSVKVARQIFAGFNREFPAVPRHSSPRGGDRLSMSDPVFCAVRIGHVELWGDFEVCNNTHVHPV